MGGDVRVQMLSPDEVSDRIGDSQEVLILDVRTEEEWEIHHIPSATLLPMSSLRGRLAELDPERETIVVCEHGMRSLSVAQYLITQAGFQNVANMIGGMSEWTGPVVEGA